MAKLDPNKFRVSSALKNIIGKELITDDFIAVFELVKNAFDAHAGRVDVVFKDIYGDNPRLIIRDNGKGMDREDIVKKWLFVAYSAKKEGTEDYRDKIQTKRIHAGSKGIGRFSCDKLGANLTVYTRRRGRDSKTNKLVVDWNIFEEDAQEEFINIPVKHSYVTQTPFENFRKGTILEMTNLREVWGRQKLLSLKKSLEKLINPNQKNDPKSFSIFLEAEEELEKDSDAIKKNNPRAVVNGKIENSIFEDLGVKTTQIKTQISSSGKQITTTLVDRGTLIYKVKEKNPYKNILKDITIHLFALNKSAKINFTKKMGIRAVQYGSVFLFKNGFRIYPFGEVGEDPFGLDRRKIQGQARYLGTRDVIGRIEINGDNSKFQETSSRDGGLIRNRAYETLEDFFTEYVLKRLEKFVVDVIRWGHEGDIFDNPKITKQEMQERAFGIIERLTSTDKIIDIEYDPKVLNILKNRSEKSVGTILHNLNVLAEKTNNELVAKEIRRAQRQYKSLLKAKAEAEAETERTKASLREAEEKVKVEEEEKKKAMKRAQKAQDAAKQKTTQNLFLQSIMSQDFKNIVSLHHHIGISVGNINSHIENLTEKIHRDEKIPTKSLMLFLERISYQANIISSITKFATKANFNLESFILEKPIDLISFVEEHIVNVCWEVVNSNIQGRAIDIKFMPLKGKKFEYIFKPIEITIITDNLIENSRKAEATEIKVKVLSCTDTRLEISFRDNGNGVPAACRNKIFDFGFSTTDGAGLGLFHVQKILEEMGGEISLNTKYKDGAEFIVRLIR
ncbi:MAG: ATP-binding protein [Planctomycetes bacterium]|nr:ATP-binding protein [Planctomycetota bacterium]